MRIPRWRLGNGVFHLVNRATNGAWILEEDADKLFVAQQFARFGEGRQIQVYNWAVMANHFHLAVEAVDLADLSYVVGQTCRRFTIEWHRRHGGSGRLWQERFKSIVVQKEGYLERLGCYIERNPVRAAAPGICVPWDYRWSSARAYCCGEPDPLVDVDAFPYWPLFGRDNAARQATYRRRLVGVAAAEDVKLFGEAGPGAIGDDAFVANARVHRGRSHARSRGRPRRAEA